MPDTVRLWDSLLSDRKRFDFLIFICCAMVIRIRKTLLGYDFGQALKLLQRYPPSDLNQLLLEAQVIKENEQKLASGDLETPLMSKGKRRPKGKVRSASNGQYSKDVQEVVKAAQANAQIASEAISSAVSSGSVMAKKWYRSLSSTLDDWSSSSRDSKGSKQGKEKSKRHRHRPGKKGHKHATQAPTRVHDDSTSTKPNKSVFGILSKELGLTDDNPATADVLREVDSILNESQDILDSSNTNLEIVVLEGKNTRHRTTC